MHLPMHYSSFGNFLEKYSNEQLQKTPYPQELNGYVQTLAPKLETPLKRKDISKHRRYQDPCNLWDYKNVFKSVTTEGAYFE